MGRKATNLTGHRFGALVALEPAGRSLTGGHIQWRCVCDCGNQHITMAQSLRNGDCTRCVVCKQKGSAPAGFTEVAIEVWTHTAGETGAFVVARDVLADKVICHSAWSRQPIKGSIWSYGPLKGIFEKLAGMGMIKPRPTAATRLERWARMAGVTVVPVSNLFVAQDVLRAKWAEVQATGTGPESMDLERGAADRRHYAPTAMV